MGGTRTTTRTEPRGAPAHGAPDLSVIIVSHEVRGLLDRCLRTVGAAADNRGKTEIIVVDNGSTDGSAAWVAENFPQVTLLTCAENRGFSNAVNLGAGRARGALLLLLNPDTEVPSHALGTLSARMEFLGADALGVRQVDGSGFVQLACGPGPSVFAELGRRVVQRRLDQRDRVVAALLERWLDRPRRVPWVAGSCLLVRRAAFEAVGGFDEGFFLFFEDIDFCLRLGRAGRRVFYDPTVTILHHRGASAARAPRSSAQHYRRSQLRFWGKHRGPWMGAAVAAYLRLRGLSPED